MRRSILGLLILAPLDQVTHADVVERRGSEPQLVGRIEVIDAAGVKIITDSGVQHIVSWDRVRAVSGDSSASMARYAEFAIQAWRARSRLERGDAAMAERLFEQLFTQTRGQTHETALVIAEGLLRCRLARGEHVAAVIPWLESARLRKALSKETSVYRLLPGVIDEQTRLCPWLAPLWIRHQGLDALAKELATYKSDDPLINWYAAAYRQSALVQLSSPEAGRGISQASNEAGAKLLQSLLDVTTSDAAAREQARSALRKQLDGLPQWGRAWARVALGLSVTFADPPTVRQQALVDLVHVPAEFRSTQPYLAAMALWKLAEGCAALGDASAATVFASEFKSQFPQLAGTVGAPPTASPPAASSRPIESTP